MKKWMIAIVMVLCLNFPVFSEDVQVELPDFPIIINDVIVENEYAMYPCFVYKDITYVPLTYDYLKGLGLEVFFDGILHIQKTSPKDFGQMFLGERHARTFKVETIPFKVHIEGRDFTSAYPLLFYKDMTYVPLTWAFAHEMLGFSYNFHNGLSINSSSKPLPIEDFIMNVGENKGMFGINFTLKSAHEDTYLRIAEKRYPFEIIPYTDDQGTYYRYSTVLSDLVSETVYDYTIVQGEAVYKGQLKTISETQTSFVFMGDIQGYKQSQYDAFTSHLSKMLTEDTDFIYLAGDLVDNGDSLKQWGYFYDSMKPFKSYPLVSAIGNHDVKGSSTIYERTFNYPENGITANRNFFFDVPNGRIAVLDTEKFSTYNEQKAWLRDVFDIEGFKIVMMHRSCYPAFYDEGFVRDFSKVFDEMGVDLVLSGHDHIYSRTQVKAGKKEMTGTTYIVGGSGSGSKYYENLEDRPWLSVVYDQDLPVGVHIQINADDIIIKSYKLGNDLEIIDEVTLMRNSNE